jgi:hypothetical protein
MKNCPPGVICIENVSFAFVLLTLGVVLYLCYCLGIKSSGSRYLEKETVLVRDALPNQRLNYPYSNIPSDVLLNPYTPPLKDERYAVPINISTNIGAVDSNYRQIGILTPVQKKTNDMIISLMGRPIFNNRSMWQYYTISNQMNNIKLPVSINGKSGSNEYGVDKLFSGDTVFVEGYDSAFRATVYDNDVIRYLPIG